MPPKGLSHFFLFLILFCNSAISFFASLFKVSIEKQEDGSYIAYNTNMSGCTIIGTGDSVAAAKKDFLESTAGVADAKRELGDEVPEAFSNVPDYKFDLSSLFEYYKMINVSAFARFVGINDTLMRQYRKGNTYISDAQLQKIEDGIHQLGNEFSRLQLV